MRRLFALACTAACTACLTFGTARADTTLVISIAADPTGLDPEAVPNNTSGFIMATVYDSLTRYKPGTVEVEPGLAQSWDISPDGLTYTFHLRKGVKFHDGTPFNAAANTSRRWTASSRRTIRTTIYKTGPVRGLRGLHLRRRSPRISALDDNTVQFKLKEPSAAFLEQPGDGVERRGQLRRRRRNTARISATIRSAPGRSSSANGSARDQIVLDANPDYWKGKPKVDHIVFKEYPDAQAALLALQRGEMQIMGDVATQVIPAIAQRPRTSCC